MAPNPAVLLLGLLLLPGASASGLSAQQMREETRAEQLLRADSLREVMSRSRPPNTHATDLADVVAVPLKVIGAPFHLLLVQLPSVVVGELSVPRAPGFVVRTLRNLRAAGVHPGVHGSIGPRSGPAASLSLDYLDPLMLDGAFSVRGSQRYRLGGRLATGVVSVEAGARWQRDAQVAFYGVGPETPNRRTVYRHEAFVVGLTGAHQVTPELVVRGDAGYDDNRVAEPVWEGDEPSLFDEFEASRLFGAEQRLRYVRFGAGAEVDLTRRIGFQDRGVRLMGHATRYHGVSGADSDFHKVRLRAQGLVALNERQLLALQGYTELTRGGARQIPFYHLAGLGGEQTALGYPDTRFRDRDMLSLTMEWRYEIWRDIHNSVRAETFVYFGEGAVAPTLGAIAREHFRASYGFGFRAARTDELLGTIYFGFSEESFQVGVSGEWRP